jgi:hypothetical protein
MLCLLLGVLVAVPVLAGVAAGAARVVGPLLASATVAASEVPNGEGPPIWKLPQTHRGAVTRQVTALFVAVALAWGFGNAVVASVNTSRQVSGAFGGLQHVSPELGAERPPPPPPPERLPVGPTALTGLALLVAAAGLGLIAFVARRRVIQVALGREHLIVSMPGGAPFTVPFTSIDAVRVEVDGLQVGERWLPAEHARVEVIEALGAAIDQRLRGR